MISNYTPTAPQNNHIPSICPNHTSYRGPHFSTSPELLVETGLSPLPPTLQEEGPLLFATYCLLSVRVGFTSFAALP